MYIDDLNEFNYKSRLESIQEMDDRCLFDMHNYYIEYDNAIYMGSEENPYFVLFSAKDHTITNCEIHPNTKVIFGCAFFVSTKLEKINIPASVTIIDSSAFFGCTSLTSITFEGTVAEWDAIRKGRSWKLGVPTPKIICFDGAATLRNYYKKLKTIE